jgi:hypothetical protein
MSEEIASMVRRSLVPCLFVFEQTDFARLRLVWHLSHFAPEPDAWFGKALDRV